MENNHPLLKSLNPVQREIVLHPGGPVLVLAGAGSGKTRVLTHKIAWLISEKNVSPNRILAMTFTNKAAAEMRQRVEHLTGLNTNSLWIGTFHSLCARILRINANLIGYTSGFTIYDVPDQEAVIKNIMNARQLNLSTISHKSVRAKISSLKNKMIAPADYEASSQTFNEFDTIVRDIYWEYEVRLKRNNAMDFDDLLNRVVQLLDAEPAVLMNYQKRFEYIFVDEYQDTNKAQFAFLKRLGQRVRNVCVVGDDDQSIYRWRGAEVENVFRFGEVFKEKNTFRLEQNYRSTSAILNAANALIAKNSKRMEKSLWTQNPEGDKPVFSLYESASEEGNAILQNVMTLKASLGYDLKDFAILYRTNAQSRIFEEKFRRNNIPYLIYGGLKFYERREIKDVLAFLKFIVNPADSVSLQRIINIPPRKIGKQTITNLQALARENEICEWDVLARIEHHGDRFRNVVPLVQFRNLMRDLMEQKNHMQPHELAEHIIEKLGLAQYYNLETTGDSIDRMENLAELLAGMREFVEKRNGETSLEEFIQEISLLSDADNPEGTTEGIKMMTVHMAKGLEFPVVFIAGLEENLFPHSLSSESEEEIEEERRLFYVALTRAQERVYISACKYRDKYRSGNTYPTRQEISRFINDIPRELLDIRGDSSGTSASDGELQQGDWINHATYGRGQVVQVEGKGKRQRTTILFDDNTMRTFFTAMSHFVKEN